tara:strand:- start:8226 stop:8768 length:543 start_codon:yes stop_codon:yes gene_type:complete
MLKIIALGGSDSAKSINKKLAVYAANQVKNATVSIVDLKELGLPMFGIDEETANGIPKKAHKLNLQIKTCDGLVISLAEHNGCYSSAFKSLYDWLSRIDGKVWQNKPMLLMGTSPGAGGAKTVIGIALAGFPRLGGNIVADFSFPSFEDNFSDNKIINAELHAVLDSKIKLFEKEFLNGV